MVMAAMTIAAVTPACARPSSANRRPLVAIDRPFAWEGAIHRGRVWAYTAVLAKAVDDAQVLSVKPFDSTGLEYLHSSGSFLFHARSRQSVGGYLSGGCITRWPPTGFGPTLDVASIHMEKGDQIALNLYLRTTEVGIASVKGIIVRVRSHGHTTQSTFVNITAKLHVWDVGAPPPGQHECDELADRYQTRT